MLVHLLAADAFVDPCRPRLKQLHIGVDYGSQASELIEPFSEILKMSVYPVGSTNEGDPALLVDASGRIYYQWLGIMYIGATLEEALVCLFDERWPHSLPAPPPDLGAGRWRIHPA